MRLSAPLSVALLLALSACAAILDGSDQIISVKARSGLTYLTGTQCKLTNNKGIWYVTAPDSVTVHRSYDDLNVKCEHDGYIANTGSAPSSTRGMAYGNIVFGGVIGAAVDMGTGSAYDYPSPIIVELQPMMGRPTVVGFQGAIADDRP
jgi:hypothetical protein